MAEASTARPPAVDVSVLVPVLDEADGIVEVVAEMTRQDFPGTVEFLFADGNSADATVALLSQLARADPRIQVLHNPRGGTPSALNVCLREARGEYVARMDAHTLYPPDYLTVGVARLRAGGADWVAGPQVASGRSGVARAVATALTSPLGRGASKRWTAAADAAEFDLDTGVFCGVWRRQDVLDSGGWDEGWLRNQDSEMAARFLRAGRRIVSVPAMAARYEPRASFRALWRQYEGYGRYRARTALRHPTSLRRSAVLPPLVVVTAAAAVGAPLRGLRRGARVGLATYAATVSAAALRSGEDDPIAMGQVAGALATMHLAHGTGFVRGAARWGIPWRALRLVAGLPPARADVAPYAGPVDAPSLRDERG